MREARCVPEVGCSKGRSVSLPACVPAAAARGLRRGRQQLVLRPMPLLDDDLALLPPSWQYPVKKAHELLWIRRRCVLLCSARRPLVCLLTNLVLGLLPSPPRAEGPTRRPARGRHLWRPRWRRGGGSRRLHVRHLSSRMVASRRRMHLTSDDLYRNQLGRGRLRWPRRSAQRGWRRPQR
jgi:hypothetical protein